MLILHVQPYSFLNILWKGTGSLVFFTLAAGSEVDQSSAVCSHCWELYSDTDVLQHYDAAGPSQRGFFFSGDDRSMVSVVSRSTGHPQEAPWMLERV